MIRHDVVEYFKQNLPAFPIETLRRQLLEEGVPALDLEDSLSEALRSPKGARSRSRRLRLVGAALAAAAVSGAIGLLVSRPRETGPAGSTPADGESGFVGQRGWVVRLPKDYIGITEFKDREKRHQVVYFCKRDTDPTNLLNEGLYGQLGIVRLEVLPSPFPNNSTGLANLSRAAAGKYQRSGEKYTIKTMEVATLPGVQVDVRAPSPRVEAFVLGAEDMYFFYGGEENEVWRDIVLSLRDARTEN